MAESNFRSAIGKMCHFRTAPNSLTLLSKSPKPCKDQGKLRQFFLFSPLSLAVGSKVGTNSQTLQQKSENKYGTYKKIWQD